MSNIGVKGRVTGGILFPSAVELDIPNGGKLSPMCIVRNSHCVCKKNIVLVGLQETSNFITLCQCSMQNDRNTLIKHLQCILKFGA